MGLNLNIKHNSTDITDITSGSITLNTANKYCEDNLSFTLSGVEFWAGDMYQFTGLCFTANAANSTIAMSVNGTPTLGQNFQTSTDGVNWITFIPGTTTITLANVGDKVYFKGNNPNGVSESDSVYYNFVMTGMIAGSGNIMSLIDNGTCISATIPNYNCFNYMFYNCISLTTAPELPATELADWCYYRMFQGCTSLITPPALPATTILSYCYCSMFVFCTSLTATPILSETTLAKQCYGNMFFGCTSLATVTRLPSTTLAAACYSYMFYNCSSLQVSDTQTAEAPYAWRIPSSGAFTNTNMQSSVFTNCAGTRSSDNMAGVAGQSYTYYTQNPPIS